MTTWTVGQEITTADERDRAIADGCEVEFGCKCGCGCWSRWDGDPGDGLDSFPHRVRSVPPEPPQPTDGWVECDDPERLAAEVACGRRVEVMGTGRSWVGTLAVGAGEFKAHIARGLRYRYKVDPVPPQPFADDPRREVLDDGRVVLNAPTGMEVVAHMDADGAIECRPFGAHTMSRCRHLRSSFTAYPSIDYDQHRLILSTPDPEPTDEGGLTAADVTAWADACGEALGAPVAAPVVDDGPAPECRVDRLLDGLRADESWEWLVDGQWLPVTASYWAKSLMTMPVGLRIAARRVPAPEPPTPATERVQWYESLGRTLVGWVGGPNGERTPATGPIVLACYSETNKRMGPYVHFEPPDRPFGVVFAADRDGTVEVLAAPVTQGDTK